MFGQVYGIDCFYPANGETVTLRTEPPIPVQVSLTLVKKSLREGEREEEQRAKSNGVLREGEQERGNMRQQGGWEMDGGRRRLR